MALTYETPGYKIKFSRMCTTQRIQEPQYEPRYMINPKMYKTPAKDDCPPIMMFNLKT